MKKQITKYCSGGGSVLASGSYLGSDMQSTADNLFLKELFKAEYVPDTLQTPINNVINGLGMTFEFCNNASITQYAVNHPEKLKPNGIAFCGMAYQLGGSAAVAYDGSDYKSFIMGFPLESITDEHKKSQIMAGILKFLIK